MKKLCVSLTAVLFAIVLVLSIGASFSLAADEMMGKDMKMKPGDMMVEKGQMMMDKGKMMKEGM